MQALTQIKLIEEAESLSVYLKNSPHRQKPSLMSLKILCKEFF